ncbi:Uncharacterized protein DAT39_008845, partial [Clarias magur]
VFRLSDRVKWKTHRDVRLGSRGGQGAEVCGWSLAHVFESVWFGAVKRARKVFLLQKSDVPRSGASML